MTSLVYIHFVRVMQIETQSLCLKLYDGKSWCNRFREMWQRGPVHQICPIFSQWSTSRAVVPRLWFVSSFRVYEKYKRRFIQKERNNITYVSLHTYHCVSTFLVTLMGHISGAKNAGRNVTGHNCFSSWEGLHSFFNFYFSYFWQYGCVWKSDYVICYHLYLTASSFMFLELNPFQIPVMSIIHLILTTLMNTILDLNYLQLWTFHVAWIVNSAIACLKPGWKRRGRSNNLIKKPGFSRLQLIAPSNCHELSWFVRIDHFPILFYFKLFL